MTTTHAPLVIVGGGVAGLVAANLAVRSGQKVVLLEKSSALGGRAATRDRNGFLFNMGPHALYSRGHLRATLDRLGVPIHGAVPTVNGGFVLRGGRAYPLPVGLT